MYTYYVNSSACTYIHMYMYIYMYNNDIYIYIYIYITGPRTWKYRCARGQSKCGAPANQHLLKACPWETLAQPDLVTRTGRTVRKSSSKLRSESLESWNRSLARRQHAFGSSKPECLSHVSRLSDVGLRLCVQVKEHETQ